MVSSRVPIDTSFTDPPVHVPTPHVVVPAPALPLSIPPPVASTHRPPPPPREKIHRPPFVPTASFDPRIVFSFYHATNPAIREVVGIREIIKDGQGPSWEKLVHVLSAKVDGITIFDEQSDMLLFSRFIGVRNERQFLAALQWTRNTGERNIHVSIYKADEETRAELWRVV